MASDAPGTVVAPDADEHWVGMRRACEILGVNQSTLRQWSDAGRVPMFLTPGGHRRYREDDLRALVERPRRQTDEGSLAGALLAVHERYDSVSRRAQHSSTWLQEVDDDARRHYRMLGNSLLQLLSTYVVTSNRRERERAMERGRDVAAQYGEVAARRGLSQSQTTEAFVVFRAPVLDAVLRWLRDHPASPSTSEPLKRVNQFMDQVLLAVAAAHERVELEGRGGSRG